MILIVETTHLCSDTAYGEVIIEQNFSAYLPNSFTPGQDGKNDIFTVYGEGILNSDMKIYNRWGDIIFHDSSAHPEWNGTGKNGDQCQDGVYIYLVKVTDFAGKTHTLTGTVTLLR